MKQTYKELEGQSEKISKTHEKYRKKIKNLKRFKQEYVVGFLGEMPFDEKNKLFISIKEIEDNELIRKEY